MTSTVVTTLVKATPRHCGVFTLARPPCTLTKSGVSYPISPIRIKGAETTHLHVVSALPTGGAPHAILRSRQNRHAMAGLRRALRFVDGSFNTPCPALGFGTIVDCEADDVDVAGSRRCMADVGVPVSDENDDDRGVEIRALGEYESGAGIDREGGCLCSRSRMSMTKRT